MLCYPLALCIVLSALSLMKIYSLRQRERELNLISTRSALSLCESSLALSDAMLEIALCSSPGRLCTLSHAAAANAAAAKEQLTVFDPAAAELNGFYTYAADCARGFALNGILTAEERETALLLSRKARETGTALSLSAESALAGGASCEQLRQSIMQKISSLSFSVSARYVKAPAVITPKTAQLPLFTREQAAKSAADFLGISPVLMRAGETQEGLIGLYCFTYSGTTICVTQNGGLIYSLSCAADCGEIQLTLERAREIALELAASLGYFHMTCIEQSKHGSRADFTLVPFEDGVLFYPDKLLVSVCLSEGKILRIDASEYLKYNCERELPELPRDMSAAASLVPEGFTLKETTLALIYADGAECLCYRLECVSKGITARIFFDIGSLEEKKIEIFGG